MSGLECQSHDNLDVMLKVEGLNPALSCVLFERKIGWTRTRINFRINWRMRKTSFSHSLSYWMPNLLLSEGRKVLLQKYSVCDQWRSHKKDGIIDLANGRALKRTSEEEDEGGSCPKP